MVRTSISAVHRGQFAFTVTSWRLPDRAIAQTQYAPPEGRAAAVCDMISVALRAILRGAPCERLAPTRSPVRIRSCRARANTLFSISPTVAGLTVSSTQCPFSNTCRKIVTRPIRPQLPAQDVSRRLESLVRHPGENTSP